MSSQVDLSQLAVHRDRPHELPGSRRHLLTRYLLPGLILLGFLGVIVWSARDSFLPARPVTVVPVLTTRAEVPQQGAAMFQAVGWIEPRPTPVLVTALAEGVIEQLLVVEGQAVQAGEPVARLIDADSRLSLEAAEADLRMREAEAEAILAKVETELTFLPYQLKAAEAHQRLCRLDLENKKSAPASLPPLSMYRAESELTTATAKVEELSVRKQRLEREQTSLKVLLEGLRKGPSPSPENSQPLTENEAGMKTALTRVRQANVAVESARLRLERMTVRAPVAGRVLALIARPGARLMGQMPSGMHEASTVVSLYDPSSLQVRVDVRFDDLPGVQPGQRVRIESAAVPGRPLNGQVLFATSQADIQKNTLQVKVLIEDPPPVLKPDMLVQATFLTSERAVGNAAPSETVRLLVPRQLVETAEGGARLWIADQVGRVARHRVVKLGRSSGELVEVLEGLTPADKLIVAGREGVGEGTRITITGEDATLGSTVQEQGKPTRAAPDPKHHDSH